MRYLAAVLVCLGLAVSANAVTLLSDDFAVDLSTWTMLDADWQIVDVNGDNMAAAGDADFSRMQKALSGDPLDDEIIVEFDGTQLSGSYRHTAIYLTDAAGVGIGIKHSEATADGWVATGILKTATNGTEWGFDELASGDVYDGAVISPGDVFSFKLVFDRVTGDCEAWGDGSLIASYTLDSALLATVANPTKVVVFTKSGWASMAVDDLNITTIPEPATLVLLGLGAFGLIRRRR